MTRSTVVVAESGAGGRLAEGRLAVVKAHGPEQRAVVVVPTPAAVPVRRHAMNTIPNAARLFLLFCPGGRSQWKEGERHARPGARHPQVISVFDFFRTQANNNARCKCPVPSSRSLYYESVPAKMRLRKWSCESGPAKVFNLDVRACVYAVHVRGRRTRSWVR